MKAKTNSQIPRPALLLGLAGLIPFIGSALLLWSGAVSLSFYSVQILVAYGAVILSFLGGVNWGAALLGREYNKGVTNFPSQLAWSVVPSLVAWLCLLVSAQVDQSVLTLNLLPQALSLIVLVAAFVLQYILDHRSAALGRLPLWFARLRLILTTGAVVSMLAGFIRIIQSGSFGTG